MVASRAARLFNIEEAREAVRQQELYILEKKEGRAKALKKDKKIVIAAVIVCFLAAFGYIFSEAVISDLGHQVVTLKEEINTVQNQNDRLGLEINQLQNMARIEEYAKLNLAMIYPEQSVKLGFFNIFTFFELRQHFGHITNLLNSGNGILN